MRSRVQKWGNNLVLRTPKPLTAEAGLKDNSPVELSVQEGELIVAPSAKPPVNPDDLLAKVTRKNLHREVDTGPAVWVAVFAVTVVCPCAIGADLANPRTPASLRVRPEFICTVRAYPGGGYDGFQQSSMKELGLDYVEGLVDFTWDHIERGDNVWKWIATDEQMDRLARAGLKVIPFLLCPKSPGLPWDETITRADPRFAAEYGEFAYQVVNRYYNHPARSG
jgi:antitoxin component of MazEF toxin-antitoxin module